MAYKPYKAKKTDIYEKYDKKRIKEQTAYIPGSVKIFGFRSGSAWKMILAILYYSFALFYIATAIYGEVSNLKYTNTDVVLTVLKYIFFIVLMFSPMIFLSDFKFRENMPLFKKHSGGSSIIGLIIIWMFCYGMVEVNLYCMSDVYNNSYKEMMKEKEKVTNKKLKELQSTTNMETTPKDETKKSSYNFNENKYYI